MNSMSGVTSVKGNAIIITTRDEKVASTVKPFHFHKVNGLSDDDCWYIIKGKAFDGNGQVPPEFETIGKEIVRKCQGFPLAANVVGGVLCHKSVEEWHLINEKGLSNCEGGENIRKILKLSFDYMSSPSLKKCFAYCSNFPKGYGFNKIKLIELWMGEELLQPSQGEDMESVGNIFLNVLLQNSLLEVSYNSFYGGLCYEMHDLVHDLASSVLFNSTDSRTPARCMFLEEELSHIPKEVAKHLLTLFLKGKTSGIMFSDFQSLHNLTIGEIEEHQLPNSIRECIHLRNLDLSNSSIKDVPERIGELSLLQTLRASTKDTPELYADDSNNYLRMVRASSGKTLPNTLKKLVNLRHLYFGYGVELPGEIGRLTNLQALPYFSVGKEKGYYIEELGTLRNLKGKLTIQS
ncbi:putative disease resistance protein RGA3 [Salvia splendens]|uniref:putative disease resistance protein RGA3 n=1 Tax=Salvia splendens TaxID=180675 RepID=UPI001C278D4C|nr:putative disease resistance protein RGA3 [Salvia splendens]